MKKMYTLIFLLFVLIGCYYFFRTHPRQATFEPPASFQTEAWTDESIDHMSIRFGDESEIILTESEHFWLVENHEADQGRIDQLFDALAKAEVTSRVSTNPQNHERFEVDERQAVRLTLFSGENELQQLFIGKNAGGESVYVRLPEDNDVYVLNNFPRYVLSKELAAWRDRQVVDLEPDQMRAVQYNVASGWSLTKSGDSWKLAQGTFTAAAVDTDKSLSWLARLRSLQAIEFGDESTEYGRPIAEFIVEEGTPDTLSAEHAYEVYPAADTSQLIVVHEDEVLFVQKDAFEQLFVPYLELLEELTPEEPAQ